MPPLASASPGGWRRVTRRAVATLMAARAGPSDILLVLPPFASPDRPSLGLSLVAGAARRAGLTAEVLYANLSFARAIGPDAYRHLCHTPTEHLFGERAFAPPAADEAGLDPRIPLRTLRRAATAWTEEMARVLLDTGSRFVGFSSTFEQTMACFALARALRRLGSEQVLLLGGANADGAMGTTLADLAPEFDHVFSGESETTVERFLADAVAGTRPASRVISGAPNEALDDLPPPDYDDFFRQHDALFRTGRTGLQLPYESSRGCWWGAKHHCTFCGLNANGMQHRTKRPERVLAELTGLSARHDVKRVVMVDNIMPAGFFSTLLPALRRAETGIEIFYEQKANLDARRMRLLREAGVTSIQPGIESLSTDLLRLMRKGTTAALNLRCLRLARREGISVAWNLLCDLPGEEERSYAAMASLIPLLHHLEAPSGTSGLSIDRFSPYFDRPGEFGITDVEPLPAYRALHPRATPDQIHGLAYHFSGRYPAASRTGTPTMRAFRDATATWVAHWGAPAATHGAADEAAQEADRLRPLPELRLFEVAMDRFLLVDTRDCARHDAALLGADEATLLLGGSPDYTPAYRHALDLRLMAEVEGAIVPLVVPDVRDQRP